VHALLVAELRDVPVLDPVVVSSLNAEVFLNLGTDLSVLYYLVVVRANCTHEIS
jgi:hypothetical protein